MLFEFSSAASIRIQNLRSSTLDVLPAKQLMHSRASGIHGIEDDKIAIAVIVAFKTNDGD